MLKAKMTQRFLLLVCSLLLVMHVRADPFPCYGNDTLLMDVRQLLVDTDSFWFGSSYENSCPGGPESSPACGNPNTKRKSVLSRFLNLDDDLDIDKLKETIDNISLANITFSAPAGNYSGCGQVYQVPAINNYLVDPLNITRISSWSLKNTPKVTWNPRTQNTMHTLIIWDPGNFFLHGLYINCKGGSLDGGEAVRPYFGPLNAYLRANTYIFAVYEQTSEMNISTAIKFLEGQYFIQPALFVANFEAISNSSVTHAGLMTVVADAYSVQEISSTFSMVNNCPLLVSQLDNFQTVIKTSNISVTWSDSKTTFSLNRTTPYLTSLTTNIDVRYIAEDLEFESCCKNYSIMNGTYIVNPFSDLPASPVSVRNPPQISLSAINIPLPTGIIGDVYTLFLLDVTSAMTPGAQEPKLTTHWLVTNIRNADVTTGDVVAPYFGPNPPFPNNQHVYMFLLLRQSLNRIDNSIFSTFCPDGNLRCSIQLKPVLEALNLTEIVGITSYLAEQDAFARYRLYAEIGLDKDMFCKGQAGYANPCPMQSFNNSSNTGIHNTDGIENQLPCYSNDTLLMDMRELLVDTERFWFGYSYEVSCPGGPQSSPACGNPDTKRKSVLSRFLSLDDNLDIDKLKVTIDNISLVNITFNAPAGNYSGCGQDYQVPALNNYLVDPLNITRVSAWSLKNTPKVTWNPRTQNTMHTLIIWDPGNFFLHGLYINCKGGSLDAGEAVRPYFGPLNAYLRANTYIFAVYEQTSEMNISTAIKFLEGQYFIQPALFVANFEAISNSSVTHAGLMTVVADAYSVQEISSTFSMVNNCPLLVSQLDNFQTVIKRSNISVPWSDSETTFSLNRTTPYLTSLTTNIDVRYTANDLEFESCCRNYSIRNGTYILNPFSGVPLNPVAVRNQPQISLSAIDLQSPTGIVGEVYTLFFLDVTSAMTPGAQEPKLTTHWLVTNIRNSNITTGDVVAPYFGPNPPVPNNQHVYMFLLLRQPVSRINSSMFSTFCPNGNLRCQIQLKPVLEAWNLTEVVGVTSYLAEQDAFARYRLYAEIGLDKDMFCKEQPGYANPCPMQSFNDSSNTGKKQTTDGMAGHSNDTLLMGVRQLFVDTDRFWFGSSYEESCPAGPESSPACGNPDTKHKSVLSRFLNLDDDLDIDKLKETVDNISLVNITFNAPAGNYSGCGQVYQVPAINNYLVDPLNITRLSSWSLKNTPKVTWNPRTQNTMHTLIIWDPGNFFLHGLYINCKGGSLDGGLAVKPYFGPLNAYLRANTYIFAVYEQTSEINITTAIKFLERQYFIEPSRLIANFDAIRNSYLTHASIMTIVADAYSVQEISSRFFMVNNCPLLISQLDNFQTVIKRSNISIPWSNSETTFSLNSTTPYLTSLTTNIDVRYIAEDLEFESCCRNYSIMRGMYFVNPFSKVPVRPVAVRNTPNIQLTAIDIRSMTGIAGDVYTLFFLDVTSAMTPGAQEPELTTHWLVTNIRNADVTTGDVVAPYFGPNPPFPKNQHVYMFLLLRQQVSRIDNSVFSKFCPNGNLRCQIQLKPVLEAWNLTEIVGVTSYLAEQDAFARYRLYAEIGLDKDMFCKGQPGYANPCNKPGPNQSGNSTASHRNSVLSLSLLLAIVSYLITTL